MHRLYPGIGDAVRAADLVVVGAGLFGLTVAERAAAGSGRRVVVLERRRHLGGNAFSETDSDTGIEVHRYGTHIFHTSNERIWEYVTRFTAFNGYRHRVRTVARGRVYPMPINLETMRRFFGRPLTTEQARALIRRGAAEIRGRPRTLEEKAVSLVGRPLYEALIRGYTAKQWQTDPRELDPGIIARLPVRFTDRDGYFDDRHQGLPVGGYAAWVSAMAAHPSIDVRLDVDFSHVRGLIPAGTPVVYTGPLDRYFGCRAGPLSWRTLDFQRQVLPVGDYQGIAVMNYADPDVPWTRVHEFRHLHPERPAPPGRTVIMREFSRAATQRDEPYYPVNGTADRARLLRYREMAAREPDVIFGGRLGSYRYLDMHMAIGSALTVVENDLVPRWQNGTRVTHGEAAAG